MMFKFKCSVLDKAAEAHPNCWWWLKADGCDVTKGLMESTTMQWSGDVDLNDGQLQEQYRAYKKRLSFVAGIGLEGDNVDALQFIFEEVSENVEYIHSSK